MAEERFVDRLYLAHLAIQNNLACELALVFFEILLVFDIDPGCRSIYSAVGRWRPGGCLRDEDGRVGRRHTNPAVELLPSHAEFAPIFKPGVAASHCGKLIASPLVRAFGVRRTCETRADPVHQSGGVLHDVRMRYGLLADALIHAIVEVFTLGLRDR